MNGIFKSSVATVFALALSTVAVTATAAEGKDKASKDWPSFRKADADNNGAISQDEAKTVSGLGNTFAQYDKNSDGQLSRSEFEAAMKSGSSGAGSTSSPSSSGSSGSSSSPSSGSSGSSSGSTGSTGGTSGSSGAGSSGSGSGSGSR
jgi:hypothetical protein